METITTSINLDLRNPELKKVANHVLHLAKIAVEKAVMHHVDPVHYPVNEDEDSMEAIFLGSFRSLPEDQRRSTTEKIVQRVNSGSVIRNQEFGSLSKIDLSSPEPVALQAETFVQRGDFQLSPEIRGNLQSFLVPLGRGGVPVEPPNDLPKPERLQFRLHEVHCIDETDGIWGNEAGEDEIHLAGLAVDSKAQPKEITRFKVSGSFDDGDKVAYSPPRVLAEFNLANPNWPKEQAVTLIMCEEDNGKFPEFLEVFYKKAKELLKEYIGEDDVSLDGIIAKAAVWLLDKLFNWFKVLWEDNIFQPIIFTSHLSALSARFLGGSSTSHKWSEDLKEFGGHYRLTYDWNLVWSKWKRIGGAAAELYASGDIIYATSPASGDIYRFESVTGNWTRIGGAGSMFATTNGELFGLSPDKRSVNCFSGNPGEWESVGGKAASIIGGGNRLYAISPDGGDVYRFEGQPGSWTKIGGPGRMFAASGTKLYALSPDRSGIYEYDDANNNWRQVGGSANRIYAGADELVATSPANGHLYRYSGQPSQWEAIGTGGLQFVITKRGIYGLAPPKKNPLFTFPQGVYWYSGEPYKWDEIGCTYSSLCGREESLYALGVDASEVWMLEG